jgi:hypothetical protein
VTGYTSTEFAVLVEGLRMLPLTCEDGRDALELARKIGPLARAVARTVTVSDWTLIDEEYAT